VAGAAEDGGDGAAEAAAAGARLDDCVAGEQVEFEEDAGDVHGEEDLRFSGEGLGDEGGRGFEGVDVALGALVGGEDFTSPFPTDYMRMLEAPLSQIQYFFVFQFLHSHVVDAHVYHDSVAFFDMIGDGDGLFWCFFGWLL
jgi:hypothetical protein